MTKQYFPNSTNWASLLRAHRKEEIPVADSLTPEKRSWNMSRISGKNTKPEIAVRSLLHRSGFRFRLNQKDLPGKPDIVLKKYKTVVFVHGCFWHRHKGCPDTTTPKTRTEFWQSKFDDTVKRDKRNIVSLRKLNWKVVVVWECELKRPETLAVKLQQQIHCKQLP